MIEVGSTFAGYRLEQLLSTDTVSTTFRAVPRRGPTRPVALRITHELRAQDGRPDTAVVARYIGRVSEAVKVSHPALVPILDAGEAGYRVWVATPLIDGVTLTRYLRDSGRLAEDDAVALLWGLADGLDRAHAAGVVHGAISPRTIHVRRAADDQPTAVLHGVGIDTLMVRSVRRDRDAIDISDVAYVSPEYLRGVTTDGRADQYALACALHHCVTGRPPFVRDTATGLFGAHMFTTPPSAAGADGDRAMAGALAAGMAKSPEARHESCIDLLRATGHATAAAQVRPTGGPGETGSADVGRRTPGRARPLGPAVGAVPTIDRARPGTSGARRLARPLPANGRPAAATPLRRSRARGAVVRRPDSTPAPVGRRSGDVAQAGAQSVAGARLTRGDAGDGQAADGVIGEAEPSADAGEHTTDTLARDQEGTPDAPRRRESRILTWPVAAMIVLLGIISTMVLAAIAREDAFAGLAGIVDRSGPGPSAERQAEPADTGPVSAGVGWQRGLLDEPLYEIDVAGESVIVTAPHRVAALDSATGATTWSQQIDVGVLTDMASTESVIAVRAAKFRALSVSDGSLLWEKPDIVAPISALTTAGATLYGIGLGNLTPEVVALDAVSGQEMWRFDGDVRGIGDDASVVASENVVAVLDGSALSVVDPQVAGAGGEVVQARWQRPVEQPWLDSLALLPDAVVMADRTGDVCAYDPADGTERWCERVPGLPDGVPTLVADRDVIVVIVGSTVTALALETGAEQWTFDAPRTLTPIAASSGRQVVVTDVEGRAHGLDLVRGFEGWRASGFGEVTAVAATPDAVYVGTRSGRIVQLQPPTEQTGSG